jgi:hypothetical protein
MVSFERIFLAAVLSLGGALPLSAGAHPPPDDVFALDAELGESAWPHEDGAAERIAELVREELARRYPEGTTALRDAHPKAHGCVRAEFAVAEDVDEALAQGAFVPGAAYPAWIRFSNGSPDPTRPDDRPDARGMAIKLMDFPGDKLLDEERDADTLDFVLISHPTFFSADPRRYVALVRRVTSRNPLAKVGIPFALGSRGIRIARELGSARIASPLEAQYWSTVPSRLGLGPDRQAVKYSARPCAPRSSVIPEDPPADYLRRAMVTTLAGQEACFEFLVQARASAAMSVEDPREEWDEDEAPFVRVATIRIPRQDFTSAAQDAFCEDLSYTPWHATAEHRPLGAVNRMRRVVYDAISAWRHERNGTPRSEPTSASFAAFDQLPPPEAP